MSPRVIMSGIRPTGTGAAHLGHWEGALKSWVKLQDMGDCYYSIVDWHALTTEYQDVRSIQDNIRQSLLDLLAVGIDPEKSTVYLQSAVKEIAELNLLLGMMTPLGWLERVPTFKEQQAQLGDRDINTYGFLGYPLLQTVDIIIMRADTVPVGEDQVFHLELAREIVRRFNGLYGDCFPEPQPFLTPIPKLPGVDGRKMSKSYGNAIYLNDSAAAVEEKIRPMVTDVRRKRRTDPGVPEDCPAFALHRAYSSGEEIAMVDAECRKAGIGCIDCKKILIHNVNGFLEPFRQRRSRYEKADVADILAPGNRRAADRAAQTVARARQLMNV
ncbi:MAG: tryptophan--tRNA ligase [Acidobacteria bacterium]|jgi:tryptophanyl-tRNA synthetase|nr:tryptophan--tRNA ligase [Acidobacteriota bacterium]